MGITARGLAANALKTPVPIKNHKFGRPTRKIGQKSQCNTASWPGLLAIAAESEYTQVRFRFSYDALLKLGILLVARAGCKVRSVPGHHTKLLAALADLSGTPDVEPVAETMRQKRNLDLYEGGAYVTDSRGGAILNLR